MIGIIIALLSGALMSIQGIFNTGVTKQTGVWVTNTFVQFTGFLLCLAIWFFKERGETGFPDLMKIDGKYMLLGGVIGTFITFTVIVGMTRLGPAKATLLIVVSQIMISYLTELFGLFGIDKVGFHFTKLIGVAVSIAGIVIFQWKS